VDNVHHLRGDDSSWYRRLFDRIGMPLAVLSPNAVGELVVSAANPALADRLGMRRRELVGQPPWAWIAEDHREVVRAGLEALCRGEITVLREECRLESRRGSIPIILEASQVNGCELALHFVDISERAQAERTLHDMAFHDPLTGVANRALLTDRLEHTLEDRQPNAALLVLDLDRFKDVNDSLGHPAGDEVLVVVARRLQDCVRTHDTVARLGGDEFAILLEDGFPQHEDRAAVAARASQIAARAESRLAEPIQLVGGQSVTIGPSIGCAFLHPASTAEQLLAEADAAMYEAKRRRREPGSGSGRIPA
jgi:diguanylate cyclase (GGDEF)-like protein/PAS domain S-box-containing protein